MRAIPSLLLAAVVGACGGGGLSPANVAASPGGSLAVSFTRSFPAGFWQLGDHAYRLVLACPAQRVGPPVVRFEVRETAPRVGIVHLRIDGPGRHVLAPADLDAVHPDAATVAVITLAGMTAAEAEEARARCEGTVTYDGLDPEALAPGDAFSP